MTRLSNWSYSRYGTWKKCPALLKFQMEDNTPRESHPAAARGTDIHKNVEEYILGKAELGDGLRYYQEFFDTIRDSGAIPELPLALDASWSPVDWDDPDRWWRGVLDCVIEGEDLVYIYDWKTGQEYGDHREQREIYAAAYFSVNPKPNTVVIHCYLDKKQNTVSNFPADSIPKIRKDWEVKIQEMFNDTRMVPNPGFHCRFCHFRRNNGGPCQF